MAPEYERSAEPRCVADLHALRVFSHPLRIDLYHALLAGGAATASHLADQVGEAVSLVSYHLRKMAAHGVIVEAPGESSDARERWWRVARGFTFRDFGFGAEPQGAAEPQGVAAVGGAPRPLLRFGQGCGAACSGHGANWGEKWSDTPFDWECLPRLTATELQQLSEELRGLIISYRERARAAEAAGDTEGREQVFVRMCGFPFRP
ncbi:winged helix-turn-helix domain-containing protein [Streptomyces candidus]|uniref:DNA-binding transcriptional ArsR family regulator n=1 Tax=Streptomyces candidus TaxID=67283 RepID=A0A7X0H9Q3_9ACTN|nr:helix-turn-helix domain-containing protein [Streptomyces candidus]MBB6433690.1 DNA-binding transcriptional ArsR family regulator [Streptomyces candidus]